MQSRYRHFYFSPASGKKLFFEGTFDSKKQPLNGFFKTLDLKEVYSVTSGIPNFIYPAEIKLPTSDLESLEWYKNNAGVYDEFLPYTFKTFRCNENKEREHLVDLLEINGDEKVLEFGCGTGRDSMRIAKRMKTKGFLFLQDISHEVLRIAIKKMQKFFFKPAIGFSLANGYYLPFKNKFFDRVFHFGGLNTFGDLTQTFKEIVRVCKPGARVVLGDENMPSWLRSSEFGKVLMNSNPHYKFDLPLKYLPVEARNVKVEWIIGGVFYVISFEVGIGLPYANLDFEIPGIRGGTHRTRFYGQIEGVSSEAKRLANKARLISGKSMYQWLDSTIKQAAKKDLRKKSSRV